MIKKILMICAITAVIFTTVTIKKAQAIPAFARKYKVSCNTCHSIVPKLKAYGEEVAGNGFILPDGEEPKRYYTDTGDESLLLMRALPLAVRFDAYLQAADRDQAKTDLQLPYGVKLLSGGPITRHVSYYFYFYISERGEVVGLEDAYVHFNNIGNSDFDLMVGQFQVSDPLFKRELRLTFEDYQIYRQTPGESRANLTYDRGLMATYGFDFGLDLVAEVINGNGIKPAGENRLFDFDNNKNFALRASQSVGPFRVGGFIYSGKETLTSDSLRADNKILFWGPDFSIGDEFLELNGQYIYREDDNPLFLTTGLKNKLEGGFAELIYMPKGDQSPFIFTALYNRIDSDNALYDYETATFSISHMAARNLRILGELTYDLITDKPRFTVGFVSAF